MREFDKYGFFRNLVVDSSTYKYRYKTCKECASFNKALKLCGECMCFMPAKARHKESECPKQKWHSVKME